MALIWKLEKNQWLEMNDEERKQCRNESLLAIEYLYFEKAYEIAAAITADRIGKADAAKLALATVKFYESITGKESENIKPVSLIVDGLAKILNEEESADEDSLAVS